MGLKSTFLRQRLPLWFGLYLKTDNGFNQPYFSKIFFGFLQPSVQGFLLCLRGRAHERAKSATPNLPNEYRRTTDVRWLRAASSIKSIIMRAYLCLPGNWNMHTYELLPNIFVSNILTNQLIKIKNCVNNCIIIGFTY